MTIPDGHMFPQISEAPPSLEELLAAALVKIERLVKLLDERERENAALRQENLALKREILTLCERLNRNSTNSNQPPSQDSPFQPPQKPSESCAAVSGAESS